MLKLMGLVRERSSSKHSSKQGINSQLACLVHFRERWASTGTRFGVSESYLLFSFLLLCLCVSHSPLIGSPELEWVSTDSCFSTLINDDVYTDCGGTNASARWTVLRQRKTRIKDDDILLYALSSSGRLLVWKSMHSCFEGLLQLKTAPCRRVCNRYQRKGQDCDFKTMGPATTFSFFIGTRAYSICPQSL